MLQYWDLSWKDYDTDRITFETAPGLEYEYAGFKAGGSFKYRYDRERWYAGIEEVTPADPDGTGNYYDVILNIIIYDTQLFIACANENFGVKAYMNNRLKSRYTTDMEISDGKASKQDNTNTSERTDYDPLYGIEGYYSLTFGKTSLVPEASYEFFSNDGENNEYVSFGARIESGIISGFRIASGIKFERYSYEGEEINFPDNVDPEDPELDIAGDDFSYLSANASMIYSVIKNFDIRFGASYGFYDEGSELDDRLSIELGAVYTLGLAE